METSPEVIQTITILGLILLFIIIVVAWAWYSSTSTESVINTPQSRDKMDVLVYSMSTLLGTKWYYVLLLITVIFVLAFYFMYQVSINDMYVVNIGEKQGTALVMLCAILVCALVAYIGRLIYADYLSSKNDMNKIPFYETNADNEQASNRDYILQVLGLGIFVALMTWFVVWYIFFV